MVEWENGMSRRKSQTIFVILTERTLLYTSGSS
jgi:hypothetical protein